MRNLKALGLALVAAFALSAVLASAASAEFTIEAKNDTDVNTITAKALNNQVFETSSGAEVVCPEVSVDGTVTGTVVNEVTVEPTYSGACTVEGFHAMIDTNGCHFLFTTTATNNVHILCPEGKQIEVTAEILGTTRPCLDIHAQTPTNATVDYTNGTNSATGKMDVTVKSTVTGITYERTGLCKGEINEANDAKYTGEVTVTADDPLGNPIGITKSKLF